MENRSKVEKARRLLILTAAAAVILLLLRLAISLLWPFLLGFLLAWLLRPGVNGISRFSGAKKSFWSAAVLLALYLLLALGLWWGIAEGLAFLQQVFSRLPNLAQEHLQPVILFVRQLFPQPSSRTGQIGMEHLGGAFLQFCGSLLSSVSGWIAKAPALFTAFLCVILSSFFISLDYPAVTAAVIKLLPQKAGWFIADLRRFLSDSLSGMIKAYALLMGITFLLSAAGLWLLRVEHPFKMALLIALMDSLPVLGPGIILLPWTITAFAGKNAALGAGLLSLYLLVSLVRTMLEPKVLGRQLGLHPLAAIVAMYIGARLGGLFGLILSPIIALYLRHLKKAFFPEDDLSALWARLFS